MPRVFLSHASEDKPIVERIARDLVAAEVEAFYDSWEIRAGDSIRRKIDEGLEGCTHFVVVLSPRSVDKPWVNAEMDAGFFMAMAGRSQLIPLRYQLRVDELPPLLAGRLSPSIDDYETAIHELIADILGVARRPPLGTLPTYAIRGLPRQAGLSIVAGQIAAAFVTRSTTGRNDPQFDQAQLREAIGAPDDDLIEAIDELRSFGWVRPIQAIGTGRLGFYQLWPEPRLFAALDHFFMPWNPEADSRHLAAELVNTQAEAFVTRTLDAQLGWGARRMNPALACLVASGAADHSNVNDRTYLYHSLRRNASTRRYVRDAQ